MQIMNSWFNFLISLGPGNGQISIFHLSPLQEHRGYHSDEVCMLLLCLTFCQICLLLSLLKPVYFILFSNLLFLY